MNGYSARELARMLDLPVGYVRSYARVGVLEPGRGPRGEYRFSFQDLVLLRMARGLMEHMPPAKVRRALHKLKQQLPEGRPLSGVQLVADGDEILVCYDSEIWDPESGQSMFNFETPDTIDKVRSARPTMDEGKADEKLDEEDLDAEDWYALGTDLESAAPEHSREAYRRALELNPKHVDARVNLGRLLHEAGQFQAAEENYRLALAGDPTHAVALFNLGVSLEDLGRSSEATAAYRGAIKANDSYADAYFNLARLLEQAGDRQAALRYLTTYRKLTGP